MSNHPQSALTNALVHETSPYLLQHAHQPVQWYPWGELALNLAKQQNKPILLSIGYSACHWCHVMAHESFEDITTAKIMNELYINIKVDREERPDIDKIYQMSLHLLLQRPGGWPLTLFLTPDQHPFFGGTYFPPTTRHGLPAFTDLLRKVASYYDDHRDEIEKQGQLLVTALQHYIAPPSQESVPINAEPLNLARQQIAQSYDEVYGGFSSAPKFPHIPTIDRLFHHYLLTAQQDSADDDAMQMALLTLKKMATGGICDQLGGGFYRYSTDERWLIPHFEKMLYDNGAFLSIYSDAWQVSRDPLFKKVVVETIGWVVREMQSPEGAFYSSLDADSEGEEGQFYLWTPERVKSVLSNEQSYTFCEYQFGLDQKANFEQKWHLSICQDHEAIAEKFSVPVEKVEACLMQAGQQLLTAREQRIHPGRDEKILTAWNALMIKGLAKAGQLFEREDYLTTAERAL
ncbi:MAG: thioredoxin domain-containing protein, partial [Beggiatoa sp. IS2]